MNLMRYRPLGAPPLDQRLGRYVPDDDKHILAYPAGAVLRIATTVVEKTLVLPSWHWTHDQGREGSCVGHGTAMERAITNSTQNKVLLHLRISTRRYDPLFFWNEAKLIDEWADTNPGDDNGTSVRAAYDVARIQGARRVKLTGVKMGVDGRPYIDDPHVGAPDPEEGILVNRWATNVDQMRTAIAMGVPITIGINWYSDFDDPAALAGNKNAMWVCPSGKISGRIRGGHCVCIYGASDKRQAFKFKNSWGRGYPLTWLPYSVMTRLLREDGEATLITDR